MEAQFSLGRLAKTLHVQISGHPEGLGVSDRSYGSAGDFSVSGAACDALLASGVEPVKSKARTGKPYLPGTVEEAILTVGGVKVDLSTGELISAPRVTPKPKKTPAKRKTTKKPVKRVVKKKAPIRKVVAKKRK